MKRGQYPFFIIFLCGASMLLLFAACQQASDSAGGTFGQTDTGGSECEGDEPCTTISMGEIIDRLQDEYNLDNVVTTDDFVNGTLLLTPPNNCPTLCMEFNDCLDDEGFPKTDAVCTDVNNQCQQVCAETFDLSGHPSEDVTFSVPKDYHAFKVTLEACVDSGRDMLFLDGAILYYRNIPGGRIIVPDFAGQDGTQQVRTGAPVGMADDCLAGGADARLGYRNLISFEGINEASVQIGDVDIPTVPIEFEKQEFTWVRPDSLPFGLRFLRSHVDLSGGVYWVIQDFIKTGGIFHILHQFDNQLFRVDPLIAIETYAPWDPEVKYEFLMFVRPRIGDNILPEDFL